MMLNVEAEDEEEEYVNESREERGRGLKKKRNAVHKGEKTDIDRQSNRQKAKERLLSE